MSKHHPFSVLPGVFCLMATLPFAPAARAGDVLTPTALVSATPGGQLQGGLARDPQISADGRYVVYWSTASDLVPGDVNGVADVFLRDTVTGTTELISVSSTAGPSNGASTLPSVSADGRYVCFDSSATNLLLPPTSGLVATYVRDRLLGTTELVSRASGLGGAQADNTSELSAISGDGRWVAFGSYAGNLVPQKPFNTLRDVFLRDRLTHTTTLVSQGPGGALASSSSFRPSLSHDGARLTFSSRAVNLVAGGTAFQRMHVYLYEAPSATLSLLSATAGGIEGNGDSQFPQIAPGGGFVVFETSASNLVPTPPLTGVTALRDLASGAFDPVNLDSLGQVLNVSSNVPTVSGDGRYVAFQSLNPVVPNAMGRLFVRDRVAGKTFAACSTDAGNGVVTGAGLGPKLSADGTMLAFLGQGDFVAGVTGNDGIYLRGVGAPLTYCVSKINSQGCAPRIGFSGEARVSNGFDLDVTGTQALNNSIGLLIHGTVGPAKIPFAGGSLCIAPPFFRSQGVLSGGSPPPVSDCSGAWTLNLGDVLALSPLGPVVTAGSVVQLQWWGRDVGFAPPNNAQLSEALQVFVAP